MPILLPQSKISGRSLSVWKKYEASMNAQVRLAHERDLVAEQFYRVRRNRTTETFVSADDLLLEIFRERRFLTFLRISQF
jgi:hypothetical protein